MDQRANYSTQAAAGKSIVWRILGIIYLWIIAVLTTGSVPIGTLITVIHHATFLVVFFVQDQAWTRIEWGKEYRLIPSKVEVKYKWNPTKWRSLVKGFVYEIIIAIPIMLGIGILITGNFNYAITIAITYTTSKIILYQVYEQVYDKKVIHFIKI